MFKRILILLIVLIPLAGFSQRKVSARKGGKFKVSKGQDQREDRRKEEKMDVDASRDRTLSIQDKKTRKRMERNLKKARKDARRKALRNRARRR